MGVIGTGASLRLDGWRFVSFVFVGCLPIARLAALGAASSWHCRHTSALHSARNLACNQTRPLPASRQRARASLPRSLVVAKSRHTSRARISVLHCLDAHSAAVSHARASHCASRAHTHTNTAAAYRTAALAPELWSSRLASQGHSRVWASTGNRGAAQQGASALVIALSSRAAALPFSTPCQELSSARVFHSPLLPFLPFLFLL